MATPLNLKFDSSGCIDTTVSNLGGVVFTDPSPIINYTDENRCATFTTFDKTAGLKIDTAGIEEIINDNTKLFTLYFRYRIKKGLMEENTPILSYRINPDDTYMVPLLDIEEKSYFSFHDSNDTLYNSPDISYTFDGKWHTFTLQRSKKLNGELYYCYFIDGCQRTYPNSYSRSIDAECNCTTPLYLGYIENEYNKIVTFNGGSLDNIVLVDENVYNSSFVPPTLYFNGSDVADNYYSHVRAKIDNIEEDTKNEVERLIQHSKYHFNEAQKDYLPRRIRIEWWQEINYFDKEQYTHTRRHHRPDTILNIRLFEHSMWFHHERFLSGNAYKLLLNDKIQPFVLFVDHKFIPLTQIDFIKSDDNLNVFISDRNTDRNEWVKSVEIITIPFPIIYEEGLGERVDLKPLYSFDKDGKFAVDNSYTYYYIDNKKNPNIAHIGIQEQMFYGLEDDDDTAKDSPNRYMRSVWRYGEFKESDVDGDDAILEFKPIDGQGSINPGDEVILYKSTTQIHRSRYDIVGENLVKFYNYKDQHLTGDIVTMQAITDTSKNITEDLTTTKIVTVTATVDQQSTFTIPTVSDDDGFIYRKFLLFRGSMCMENKNRYTIDYDKNTITFNNTDDFVDIGTDLLFVFVKIQKADQYGILHVKPIYLYTKAPETHSGICTTVPIPNYRGLEYNINQVMMFVQNTFISPNRYKIEDNKIIFTQTGDYLVANKSVTFILLKMANKFEDPLDDRDKLINEQLKKGNRFVLYDLNIDKKRKITLDNFVTFDQNGEYIPDLYGYIYNMNIVKELHTGEPLHRKVRFLTCVYFKDSLENLSNITIPDNNTFIKDYISLRQEFYEMDNHFDEFVKDFDIYHSQDKSYGVNLANALNYIVTYNQNLLDRIYENNSTCTRRTYKGKDLNFILSPRADGKYDISMYGDTDYKNHKHHSYTIFFVNGELAKWNDTIKYHNNEITFTIPKPFKINDVIESIHFNKTHKPFLIKIPL